MRKLMAMATVCGLIAVMAVAAMTSAQSTATLNSGTNSKFGPILTDAKGMALYTYDKDTPNHTNCTDPACVGDWPPPIASGQLTLAIGLSGTVGSITRSDGTKQVTYNQRPVYTFVGDQKPGEVTGDGIEGFSVVKLLASKPTASPAATTLTVREDAKLGKFFADAKGRTLYIYTADSAGRSACNGSCAENWPPLNPSGALTLPSGVSGILGTITRQDGSKQVTYTDFG